MKWILKICVSFAVKYISEYDQDEYDQVDLSSEVMLGLSLRVL